MPARLGHPQSRTSSVCSEMTGQWSDRSAMSCRKTLSPLGPMSYLCGLALGIWTSFWRREDSIGMDMWNAPMVQSRQPLTYRLMESVSLGGPKWHGSSWQRGIAESGSSRLSTLMIDVPGDLVWDLPCVQHASYLEGGPLMWMLPLYLHINQKSDYDDMIWWGRPNTFYLVWSQLAQGCRRRCHLKQIVDTARQMPHWLITIANHEHFVLRLAKKTSISHPELKNKQKTRRSLTRMRPPLLPVWFIILNKMHLLIFLNLIRILWHSCTYTAYILTLLQVSNHYLVLKTVEVAETQPYYATCIRQNF